MLAANCAELVTEETVKNSFSPATASAEPVEVITSEIAFPNTSVPTTVFVFALSPVPVVVTVTFLAPPPKKVVSAIVAAVFGRAAVTKRSGSAAFSSVINVTCTSVCIPIVKSPFEKKGAFTPCYCLVLLEDYSTNRLILHINSFCCRCPCFNPNIRNQVNVIC